MGKRIDPVDDVVYMRIGIPPRIKKRIVATAKRDGVSMSAYIRNLVARDLARRKAKRDALKGK